MVGGKHVDHVYVVPQRLLVFVGGESRSNLLVTTLALARGKCVDLVHIQKQVMGTHFTCHLQNARESAIIIHIMTAKSNSKHNMAAEKVVISVLIREQNKIFQPKLIPSAPFT